MSATDRHLSRLLRLAITAACVGMWLWLRRWPTAPTLETAVGLAVVAALLTRPGGALRSCATLVALFVVAFNLAAFYRSMATPEPLRERLSAIPFGRGVLVVSVLWALSDSLFSAEPILESGIRRLGDASAKRAAPIVYCLSVALVVVFAADMFFLAKGEPFTYPLPSLHPVDVSAGQYAGAHAAERFVFDLRHNRFSQRKPDGTIRIILNGASTMWGHGLEARDAPPAVLSRLLAARYPERHFEVVCLAWRGKYQLNELVDSSISIPHWQPDLVVSFNGFNEVWYGEDTNRFEALPVWQPQLTAALSVPPSTALFYSHSHYGAGVWPARIDQSSALLTGLHEPDLYEAPRYYDYLDSTARVLSDHRIRYVYSFCPNRLEMQASEGTPDAELEGAFDEVRQRRPIAERVVTAAKQQSYDAMAPLSRLSPELAFQDACHLTKAGVEAVMTDVAAHVPAWLEAPLPDITVPASSTRLGPLRLRASPVAEFFTVGVGVRDGTEVRSSGDIGLLESGPPLDMPAGRYRVRFYGTVEAPGRARVELGPRNAASGRAETHVTLAEGEGTHLLASLDADLATAVHDLEFRFFVESKGLRLRLRRIIFEEVWRA